jgi:hypothetical protein
MSKPKKKRTFKDWYGENQQKVIDAKRARYENDPAYRAAGKARVRDKYNEEHQIFEDGSRVVTVKGVRFVAFKLTEAATLLEMNINTLRGYINRNYFPEMVFDDTKLKMITVDQIPLIGEFLEAAVDDGASKTAVNMKAYLKKNWRARNGSKEIINQKK